jgi:hypothetical protein
MGSMTERRRRSVHHAAVRPLASAAAAASGRLSVAQAVMADVADANSTGSNIHAAGARLRISDVISKGDRRLQIL